MKREKEDKQKIQTLHKKVTMLEFVYFGR